MNSSTLLPQKSNGRPHSFVSYYDFPAIRVMYRAKIVGVQVLNHVNGTEYIPFHLFHLRKIHQELLPNIDRIDKYPYN